METTTDDESISSSGVMITSDEVKEDDREPETLLVFFLQTTPALLLAGLGTVFTGFLYYEAERFKFFTEIHHTYMITPPILGLKGNIEMTLASRLSTVANRQMFTSSWREWARSWLINLSLLCTQAFGLTLIACLTTGIAMAIEYRSNDGVKAITLFSSALTATTLATVILGTLMCLLVYLSMLANLNPDNIATPLSASSSDVVTLLMFMHIGETEFNLAINYHYALNLIPVILNVVILPGLAYVSYRNKDTRPTLVSGWTFLVLAVLLSSLGGYVLKLAEHGHPTSAAFQPLLSGLCGNRASIMCSRLSTEYNLGTDKRHMDAKSPLKQLCNPMNVFNCQSSHSKCGIILIVSSVPVQLMFIIIVYVTQDHSINVWFTFMLVAASLVQVTFLIYLSHCFVALFSRYNLDPDNCAIPVITSIGDLTGAGLLFLVFFITNITVPSSAGMANNKLLRG